MDLRHDDRTEVADFNFLSVKMICGDDVEVANIIDATAHGLAATSSNDREPTLTAGTKINAEVSIGKHHAPLVVPLTFDQPSW